VATATNRSFNLNHPIRRKHDLPLGFPAKGKNPFGREFPQTKRKESTGDLSAEMQSSSPPQPIEKGSRRGQEGVSQKAPIKTGKE